MTKLSELRKQVLELNNQANTDYKGKVYLLPVNILEGGFSESVSRCKVLKVDLQENSVELEYEEAEDDDLWTAINIEDFEKYAEAE